MMHILLDVLHLSPAALLHEESNDKSGAAAQRWRRSHRCLCVVVVDHLMSMLPLYALCAFSCLPSMCGCDWVDAALLYSTALDWTRLISLSAAAAPTLYVHQPPHTAITATTPTQHRRKQHNTTRRNKKGEAHGKRTIVWIWSSCLNSGWWNNA